nr:hypothetical protein Itr_chr12CG12390 [Ipomoea trifida]
MSCHTAPLYTQQCSTAPYLKKRGREWHARRRTRGVRHASAARGQLPNRRGHPCSQRHPPCSTLEPAPTQTTTPASGGAIGTSVDAWTLLATLLHGESDGLILASHTLAGRFNYQPP